MVARRHHRFILAQLLSDLFGIGGGLVLAWWIRFESGLLQPGVPATDYPQQWAWAVVLWVIAFHLAHVYQNHPQILSFNRARRVLLGGGVAIMLVVARNYFTLQFDVSRLLYPLAFVCVSGLVILFRWITQRTIIRGSLKNAESRSRILIVGTGAMALRLAARCRFHPEFAYELIGFAVADRTRTGRNIKGVPIIGHLEDIRSICREHRIDEVFVNHVDVPTEAMEALFLEAEMENARVNVIPDLAELLRTQIYYDEVSGIPVYSIKQTPLHGLNSVLKRVCDVAFSSLGLVLLSPALLLIWLRLKAEFLGVAPIYQQPRLGMDGEEFTCLKFRTMPPDAEKNGPGWGAQEDPRATPFGRFLRRWNLDELPQLWNVLRGEMSLVGPRPERPHYVDRFKEQFPRYMARHRVKAGMTGWAQVHGLRGDTSIQQRLRYDLYYIEHWSLWLDLKILIMTFAPMSKPAVRRIEPRRDSSEVSIPPCLTNDSSTSAPSGSAEPAADLGAPSR